MKLKTQCINCLKWEDFTETVCQDCLHKLYNKEQKLKEIEEFVDIMLNNHSGAYAGSSGIGRLFVGKKIKKILEG